MAYRRPLKPWQMVLFALLWLALAVPILWSKAFNGLVLLVLLFSGFTVFYPIVKSWRERRGK